VRRADNLTTFMCRLSRNLGASTSWNPKGLSRPVMGLLYLCFYYRDETVASEISTKQRIVDVTVSANHTGLNSKNIRETGGWGSRACVSEMYIVNGIEEPVSIRDSSVMMVLRRWKC
jgi:hypothetical protein